MITFATPNLQIYHSIFIKNPAESFNFVAYIEPMHYLSWITIFIMIFVLPPVLSLTMKFPFKDYAYKEFTISKCYIYICSTLTMRGWNILPNKISSRIALYSILAFGTLIFWHWEAMLISYLATRITILRYKSIPELLSLSSDRYENQHATLIP